MSGIYIHIPFCKKACHYCNFHFSTQTQLIRPFIDALVKEIELQKKYLPTSIETIYFGGGTPSLLSSSELNQILDKIQSQYTLAEHIEITLEANPDDITEEKVAAWKKMGINRLSIGIQSFQPAALQWMNRAHTIEQSHSAIQWSQKNGIENISIDLIYGTPSLSDEALLADLSLIKKYGIQHVSCYALTVEEKTALKKLIEKKEIEAIDPKIQLRHFEIVVEYLENMGMEHYEISNFSMPGFRSKHNSNYWKGIPYLGVGPSAHSFNTKSRQWNIAHNALYIQSIQNSVIPFELEILSDSMKYNEYIMTGLRCIEGIDTALILEKFGITYKEHTDKIAHQMISKDLLHSYDTQYYLNKNARFLADGIAADFFLLD